MKRKASTGLGPDHPPKLVKENTSDTVASELNSLVCSDTTVKPTLQAIRLPSFRQKKPPTWLASFVTGGLTKLKEDVLENVVQSIIKPTFSDKKLTIPRCPVQNKPKLAEKKLTLPRCPTLVPPSKAKAPKINSQSSKKAGSIGASVDSVLRRQSTLNINKQFSQISKNDSLQKSVIGKASKKKTATEILADNDFDSDEDDKAAPKLSSQTCSSKTLSLPSFSPSPSNNIILSKSECNGQTLTSISVNGIEDSTIVEMCVTPNGSTVSDSGKKDSVDVPFFSDNEKPTMQEVVICISTSGALKEHLSILKERIRETVWRLQSLIPSLRIGVMAHTQGSMHNEGKKSAGHSGTKWLDLGATLSQICMFVDSLEAESSTHADYVADNLEMALWKIQRCMTWSSCSYRSVIMVGRGRPNRTSFYHQKDHWRTWIRSALELEPKQEVPIIDWELEAKMLSQMSIHVFTVQAVDPKDSLTVSDEEVDEGNTFFRRVAYLTNAQHINMADASLLMDIIISICCSCQSPELLQEHRDKVRDENDGVLPVQLKDVFVSLQLHSNRRSLATVPAGFGRLQSLANVREKLSGNRHGDHSPQSETDKKEDVNANFTNIKVKVAGSMKNLQKETVNALSKTLSVKSRTKFNKTNTNKKSVHKSSAVKKGSVEKAKNKLAVNNKTQIKTAALKIVKKTKQNLSAKGKLSPRKSIPTEKKKALLAQKAKVKITKSTKSAINVKTKTGNSKEKNVKSGVNKTPAKAQRPGLVKKDIVISLKKTKETPKAKKKPAQLKEKTPVKSKMTKKPAKEVVKKSVSVKAQVGGKQKQEMKKKLVKSAMKSNKKKVEK